MLGLICPELGVIPLVDPGTDVEDERPTPVGSPSPVVDGVVPLSAPLGVDMELAHVFQDVGVLPAMVTPVVDPEGGGVRDDPCEVHRAPDSGFIGGCVRTPGCGFYC